VVMEAFRIAWPWRRGYARSGGDFKAGGGLRAGSGARFAGSQRDSRGRARDGARVRRMAADETVLYLVHVDAGVARHPDPSPDLVELAPGLYLTESSRTRSQVYHALKRRFEPRRLLVAPLAGDPKF